MWNPLRSLNNSCCGLKSAWLEDRSFRVTMIQFVIGIALATWLCLHYIWPIRLWLLLVASLFPMVIAETINSSIEAVADKASPELHPLAKKAKDIGSAAVLISRILILTCWYIGIYDQVH